MTSGNVTEPHSQDLQERATKRYFINNLSPDYICMFFGNAFGEILHIVTARSFHVNMKGLDLVGIYNNIFIPGWKNKERTDSFW